MRLLNLLPNERKDGVYIAANRHRLLPLPSEIRQGAAAADEHLRALDGSACRRQDKIRIARSDACHYDSMFQ